MNTHPITMYHQSCFELHPELQIQTIHHQNRTFYSVRMLESSHQSSAFDLFRDFNIDMPERIKYSHLKRQNEFFMGRFAARLALDQFDVEPDFILHKGDQGQPIWPETLTGSISHSMQTAHAGVAVAFVCKVSQTAGIDIESKQNHTLFLNGQISLQHFLNAAEQKRLSDYRISTALLDLIIFSAKESVIKAIFNQDQRLLSFPAIHCINIDLHKQLIVFCIPSLVHRRKIHVHYVELEHEILTYCTCLNQV